MSIVDFSTAVLSTTTGITITSGASNTKGAWTEAIASTSEETHWIKFAANSGEFDENFLIDIGVGAASSEVVQIANIASFANQNGNIDLLMPLTIASGSRVAIRCQATTASQTLRFMVYLSNDSGFGTSTSNITLGSLTASSKGTVLDPGSVDNTKGSYVELDASTSIEMNYVIVLMANNDNASQTNQRRLVDVSTGAAASEVDVIPNILFFSNVSEAPTTAAAFFQTIASGTRIAARTQSSNSTGAGSNDRLMDICILGFKLEGGTGATPSILGFNGLRGGMQ